MSHLPCAAEGICPNSNNCNIVSALRRLFESRYLELMSLYLLFGRL